MFGFSQKITDPVCGMKLDKDKAKFSSENVGTKYSFCSENCKSQFDASPKDHAKRNTTEDCCQSKTDTAKAKSCC